MIIAPAVPEGLPAIYKNVGLVTGKGGELVMNTRLVDRAALSWDLRLQASRATNLVDRLGSFTDAYLTSSGSGALVVGHPLYVHFTSHRVKSYNDANGNGFLEPDEITWDTTRVFYGTNNPTGEQSLSTTIGLLKGALRIGALFDRRTGATGLSAYETWGCSANSTARCRAFVDANSTLEEQARFAPLVYKGQPGTLERKKDFTRWRELSVRYELPGTFARAVRADGASLSLQGRNLHIWSSYPGDPEDVPGDTGQPQIVSPLVRSWTLRLDLRF
jgi:hypothetical protein